MVSILWGKWCGVCNSMATSFLLLNYLVRLDRLQVDFCLFSAVKLLKAGKFILEDIIRDLQCS